MIDFEESLQAFCLSELYWQPRCIGGLRSEKEVEELQAFYGQSAVPPAEGADSSTSELGAEGISYNMVGEKDGDRPFKAEQTDKNLFKPWTGELQGLGAERAKQKDFQSFDPLTEEEQEHLQDLFVMSWDQLIAHLKDGYFKNVELPYPLELDTVDQTWQQRALATDEHNASAWGYEYLYFSGESEPVINDKAWQADEAGRWSQEVQGCEQHRAEEAIRESKQNPLVGLWQGDVKLIGGEESLYLWRCHQNTIDNANAILAWVHTAPLAEVKRYKDLPRTRYIEGVKRAAPSSKRTDRGFVDAPLPQRQGLQKLLDLGYRPEQLRRTRSRYWKGAAWHKLFLKKDQLEEIERAIERRLHPTALVKIPGELPVEMQVPAEEGIKLHPLRISWTVQRKRKDLRSLRIQKRIKEIFATP